MTTTDHDSSTLVVDLDQPASDDSDLTGAPPVERVPAELQAAARQAWLDNPAQTGAELGARFDRGERWGRDRIAEAKARTAAPPPTAPLGPPAGTNGSHPTAAPAPTAPAARPGGNRPAAGRQLNGTPDAATRPDGVPPALVAVTVAAVAIVALVTMFTSYSHTRDLATAAGQSPFVAWILPAAVDGLVIAGSTSLLVDHHLRRPGSALAWAAVALGLVSSMAANVVAVDPTLVDLRHVKWVMAAYAPLALAVSGHLLLRMLSQRR